jgi:hypothetical protein
MRFELPHLASSLLLGLAAILAGSAGCTKDPAVAPTPPRDLGSADMPATDMPSVPTCTSSAQCDDGEACTIDGCGASGRCEYTTIDAMCAADEVCVVGMGCIRRGGGACTTDPECDDGNFCNGAERCAGRVCVSGGPESCDDGNACTVDSCNPTLERCERTLAAGCDAGVAPGDGGRAMPFESPRDYSGRFLFVPAQSSGCGAATYAISAVTFATTATTLTVTAGSFPMTQTPVPTGPMFDVTYVQPDCGTYRLVGTFTDSDSFTGTWSADFSGGGFSCGSCPGMTASVIGVRS